MQVRKTLQVPAVVIKFFFLPSPHCPHCNIWSVFAQEMKHNSQVQQTQVPNSMAAVEIAQLRYSAST